MHAPRAAVKLPQSFTVPQPYHNTNGVSFVTILSCEGFCSCRKENLGVGAAGRNPGRENSALALTNKLFRGKARVAALYCKIFSPFTNQQCMGRVMHDIQRDSPRMQKIAHSGYSTDT